MMISFLFWFCYMRVCEYVCVLFFSVRFFFIPFDFSTELDEVRAFMVSYSPFAKLQQACSITHICICMYDQCGPRYRMDKKKESKQATTKKNNNIELNVKADKCTKYTLWWNRSAMMQCACVGALLSIVTDSDSDSNQMWIKISTA